MVSNGGFLVADNLAKHFSELKAVDKVNFSIEEGSITGLIGPNGAGKTTIINLITCRLKKTEGKVFFKGNDISDLSPYQVAEQGIGQTFQITKPLTDLSVEESVLTGNLFGKNSHAHVGKARDRAREILDFIDLIDKKDQPVTDLTVADQRRVQFAQTIAMDLELLLLDELMAGLNPQEIDRMLELIQEAQQRLNLTILFIEHVMQAVMNISESIIVIDNGKKIAEGIPGEIKNNPEVIEAYLGKGFKEEEAQ